MRHLRPLFVTLTAVAVSLGLLLGAGAQAEELVKYEIVGGERIDKSLTGQPGDPVNGRKVAIDRKLGNCLLVTSCRSPSSRSTATSGPTFPKPAAT